MRTNVISGSKKTLLVFLGLTSVGFGRGLFLFLDDPEGPNLLVVLGMAVILYVSSLGIGAFGQPITDRRRFFLAVLIQFSMAVIFSLLLR